VGLVVALAVAGAGVPAADVGALVAPVVDVPVVPVPLVGAVVLVDTVVLGRHWQIPLIKTGKALSGQQLSVFPMLHTLSNVGSHMLSVEVTLLQVANSTQAFVVAPVAVTFSTQTTGEEG